MLICIDVSCPAYLVFSVFDLLNFFAYQREKRPKRKPSATDSLPYMSCFTVRPEGSRSNHRGASGSQYMADMDYILVEWDFILKIPPASLSLI